jgi:hypothetical protein
MPPPQYWSDRLSCKRSTNQSDVLEHNTVAAYQAMAKIRSNTAFAILGILPQLLTGQETSSRFALESYAGSTRMGVDEFVLGSPNLENGRNAALRSNVFVPSRGERITVEIDFDAHWEPRRVQFSVDGADSRRTWSQISQRRITFRSVTTDGESARELPRRGVVLAFHPDVPSLLSPLPYLTAGTVSLFFIQTAEIIPARLVDHGTQSKTVGTNTMTLRYLELVTNEGSFHCWFEPAGNLALVEIPHQNLRIVPRIR